MERTLVILKPSAVARGLCGEVITRLEKKGLRIVALKMANLSDKVLEEHYAHLVDRPFFPMLKRSMQATPVMLMCVEGVDAIHVVHEMAGATNGRKAAFGTIRGDMSMSGQQNIIHTSDGPETAKAELDRFFVESDYCDYARSIYDFTYAEDEF